MFKVLGNEDSRRLITFVCDMKTKFFTKAIEILTQQKDKLLKESSSGDDYKIWNDAGTKLLSLIN